MRDPILILALPSLTADNNGQTRLSGDDFLLLACHILRHGLSTRLDHAVHRAELWEL